MERGTRNGLFAAASLLLVAVGFIGYCAWSFKSGLTEVTDARQYQVVLAELGYPKPTRLNVPALAHFPAVIPTTASQVRLFYCPGALQAATMLQLRMALPAAELAAILKTTQPLAKHVMRGDGCLDDHTQPGWLRSTNFRDASNATIAPLPDDFQTFVLDARSSSLDGSWNHGYSYGVSVSEKQSEVIYWLEDW